MRLVRTPMHALKSLLRKAACRLLCTALARRAAPLPPFRTILVVAPHPDDETLGCGGTLAQFAASGARIDIVVVTDGSASHPGHPDVSPERLSLLRRAELGEAARLLGIPADRLHFLGVRDGTLDKLAPGEASRVAEALGALLERLEPEVVFAPSRRDGSSEHDHCTALLARVIEAQAARPRLLEFPIWALWHVRPLWTELRSRTRVFRSGIAGARRLKAAALAAHASQVRPLAPQSSAALPADFAALFDQPFELFFEC